MRKHQIVKKKKKKKRKEREREKWMQEFSSSCERILINQKTWDSMKDHSSWEGWEDTKIHQEKKFNQIEEDEENNK